jgi:hypothetical protein
MPWQWGSIFTIHLPANWKEPAWFWGTLQNSNSIHPKVVKVDPRQSLGDLVHIIFNTSISNNGWLEAGLSERILGSQVDPSIVHLTMLF